MSVSKGNNKITELRTILQREGIVLITTELYVRLKKSMQSRIKKCFLLFRMQFKICRNNNWTIN